MMNIVCDKKDTRSNSVSEKRELLSVIPLSDNKVPIQKWKHYQKQISPESLWLRHLQDGGMVGIITGTINGNLECIDIDVKHDPENTIMDEFSSKIPQSLHEKLLIQLTPSGGYHMIYRCKEAVIEGNQQLALNHKKEPIIETRGEGGYLATGHPHYKILQGNMDLVSGNVNIPEITPSERNILLQLARSLTRYLPGSDSMNYKPVQYKEPAINEFNHKYSLVDIFVLHGWEIVKEDDQKYYLLREGSSAEHSGYYFKETKTLFCFSTATEFDPGKPYNNFQILQVLRGKGDYKSTLRLLPEYGFHPSEKAASGADYDQIAGYLNDLGVRYDTFIQDLTLKGMVIEEMDYNTLYIDLQKVMGERIPRTRFEETIKSHYIQTINPILDFVEKHKDRNPRDTFKKWLDCIELKNKTINKARVMHFMKKWYVGMIAQALDGDYPNEFFLTLLSVEQGIGKTTFLRNYTLPKELQEYRKEHSLSFDDDFKVLMGQSLLVIDDEMDGRTYEADKTFKTVLSTKEMTTRRKYDRRISTIKRRCSFAGSGNNLNVVREIKNRRIIPVEVEKFHYEMLDKVDYIDLFMEAYHMYTSGFEYSYQREDMNLLQSLYDDYIVRSDLDLLLDQYIAHPASKEDQEFISNLNIIHVLSNIYPHMSKRINALTIGKIMNERGYRSERKGRKKLSGYIISKDSEILDAICPVKERLVAVTAQE